VVTHPTAPIVAMTNAPKILLTSRIWGTQGTERDWFTSVPKLLHQARRWGALV
jgi:hypothetical protein